jgi:hypothetical protein
MVLDSVMVSILRIVHFLFKTGIFVSFNLTIITSSNDSFYSTTVTLTTVSSVSKSERLAGAARKQELCVLFIDEQTAFTVIDTHTLTSNHSQRARIRYRTHPFTGVTNE